MDAIVKQPGVKSVISGGDSAAAAINLGRADKFSWISLVVEHQWNSLKVKVLPGLAALTEKKKINKLTRKMVLDRLLFN